MVKLTFYKDHKRHHSPKEVCLVGCAIQRRGKHQFRIFGLLSSQCPKPHRSHHKDNWEDDLSNEASDIPPGMVEPLNEQCWCPLKQQWQTLQAFGSNQELIWVRKKKVFCHGSVFVKCRELMVVIPWEYIQLPALHYRQQIKTTKLEHAQWSGLGQDLDFGSWVHVTLLVLFHFKCIHVVNSYWVYTARGTLASRCSKLFTSCLPSCNLQEKRIILLYLQTENCHHLESRSLDKSIRELIIK